MNKNTQTRRSFIQTGTIAGAVALTAQSYARVIGANDTIRVGLIGCGGRNSWHCGWLHRSSQVVKNQIVAVCDIWDQKRGRMAEMVKDRYGAEPKKYKDYLKLLADIDVDAVTIATPDHQHCPMLIDAVKAGKDVYVEKPIATTLDELNEAYKTVKASQCVVQNGSQGRSSKGAAAAKEFIQSDQLGQIIRVEESRSHYAPYWNNYSNPNEEDTSWNKFLYNRPPRPFDADQHGAWMGYADFCSSGTIGGWMSHFSDFTHYVTGCGFPKVAVCHGTVISPTSEPQRTEDDNIVAVLEYPEKFMTMYTTHFGNAANDYTMFFGTKGIMRINDPDGNVDGINPRVSGLGSEHPDKLPMEERALDEIPQDDHMVNWLKCIHSRKAPNANMDEGYKQGIAVLMAHYANREGRRMKFNREEMSIYAG